MPDTKPQLHDDPELIRRLKALELLLKFFRPERFAHLVLSSASFVTLLVAAGMMIIRGTAGVPELTAIFGSSGLITYSSGRLLHMWNQAFKVVYDNGD